MFELLIFLFFVLLFEIVCSLLELLLEFQVLLVIEISHMEGHGNVFKGIDLLGIVVVFQIHE
jgi:hypothetical protein